MWARYLLSARVCLTVFEGIYLTLLHLAKCRETARQHNDQLQTARTQLHLPRIHRIRNHALPTCGYPHHQRLARRNRPPLLRTAPRAGALSHRRGTRRRGGAKNQATVPLRGRGRPSAQVLGAGALLVGGRERARQQVRQPRRVRRRAAVREEAAGACSS